MLRDLVRATERAPDAQTSEGSEAHLQWVKGRGRRDIFRRPERAALGRTKRRRMNAFHKERCAPPPCFALGFASRRPSRAACIDVLSSCFLYICLTRATFPERAPKCRNDRPRNYFGGCMSDIGGFGHGSGEGRCVRQFQQFVCWKLRSPRIETAGYPPAKVCGPCSAPARFMCCCSPVSFRTLRDSFSARHLRPEMTPPRTIPCSARTTGRAPQAFAPAQQDPACPPAKKSCWARATFRGVLVAMPADFILCARLVRCAHAVISVRKKKTFQ